MRLASGLVLFAYLASHLANHALGLVSLQAAETARLVIVAFWRSMPMTVVFYGALLVHIALALAAVYQRHTLRMPRLELLRVALGFLVPFLLAGHFAGTRVSHSLAGFDDTYAQVVPLLWGSWPIGQLVLVVVAWTHGCLGLHFAFHHRPAWRRFDTALAVAATLLPTLALLGFVAMSREVQLAGAAADASGAQAAVVPVIEALLLAMAMLLGAVMAARALRAWRSRQRGGMLAISYPGRVVHVPRGFTVLEASRLHGIPHLSLCGGRARCSTCRVRVDGAAAELPAMAADERRTLTRIGADAETRLACQLRPTCDITVRPLLAAGASGSLASRAHDAESVEREVAILFIDLRRWTSVAESHLPFDLVYVLNQYFTAVGDAVREAGGLPNQFIGDSVMAIFGLDADIGTASRQAMAAAAGIERRMAALNVDVQRDFGPGRSLDFGIGIHAGMAVVGSVGYRDTRTLSAVGDAVNTASRLQELTKTYSARLVLSEAVARHAGLLPSAWPAHDITVRGRAAPLTVFAVSALPGA